MRLDIEGMVKGMEPQTVGLPLGAEAAQISMAISMKRIADFICGTDVNSDIVTYVLNELRLHR